MKYQKPLNNKIQCLICPRKCILANGQKGFCHVRKNINNEIISTTYGYNTGLAIDPVEKKPLYHFYPGSKILSFGTLGCVLGCKFCQNHLTSKSKLDPACFNKNTPDEIVKIAKDCGIKSVAFTYNDPVVFYEYAIDTAKLCKEEGIKTVAITSGYMNIDFAKEFFKYIDAANIDLKAFNENFYRRNCLGSLFPILDVIKYVKNDTNCHVELTTMLIEGENNSFYELKDEFDWILNNLGENIPLHLIAFYPRYKFAFKKPTGFETLIRAYDLAYKTGLNYAYTGNLANLKTSSTFCKKCHKPLIIRGSEIEINLNNDKCIYCGTTLDGCFT